MNKITLLLLITVNIITAQEIMIEVDNSVELDKSQEDYERINAEIIDPRNVTALKTLNGGDNIMLFQRKKDFINLTKVLIKNAYPLNFNEIFDFSNLSSLSVTNSAPDFKKTKKYPINKIEKLSIKNCNIYKLPDFFFDNNFIKSINLNYNSLFELPEKFNCANLQFLSLKSNDLKLLPENFSYLESLKFLYLSNNKFTKFPDEILSLKNLIELNLAFNSITQLPDNINLLVNLEQIDLTKTKIKKLPKTFRKLKNLKVLYLTKENLTSDEIKDITKKLPRNCELRWNTIDFYSSAELDNY